MEPANLVLATGEIFAGFCLQTQTTPVFGEVVFNTGMVGYMECLTDPSYAGQILTFTYPLIGNYGVPERSQWESPRLQARAMVVSELAPFYFHPSAQQSLADFCRAQHFPCLFGVDTRALTKCIRDQGVIAGAIVTDGHIPTEFIDINQQNLVGEVTVAQPISEGSSGPLVIVIDCGIKENILRYLRQLPIRIKRVPYDYDFTQEAYDGVFISNGPGDPAQCQTTIAIIQRVLMTAKPLFGICLGAQLLALAAGARTHKLRFGHRAQNQPCLNLDTQRCVLTSQNHGYSIVEESLPDTWHVSFRNLNDNTVQGIRHKSKPFFAVQFHPEAAPGPTDTAYLFNDFYHALQGTQAS